MSDLDRFNFHKSNYWIRYKHEGKLDNQYGRYINIQAVIRDEKGWCFLAYCRKTSCIKKFYLDNIQKSEPISKHDNTKQSNMLQSYKKGEY